MKTLGFIHSQALVMHCLMQVRYDRLKLTKFKYAKPFNNIKLMIYNGGDFIKYSGYYSQL